MSDMNDSVILNILVHDINLLIKSKEHIRLGYFSAPGAYILDMMYNYVDEYTSTPNTAYEFEMYLSSKRKLEMIDPEALSEMIREVFLDRNYDQKLAVHTIENFIKVHRSAELLNKVKEVVSRGEDVTVIHDAAKDFVKYMDFSLSVLNRSHNIGQNIVGSAALIANSGRSDQVIQSTLPVINYNSQYGGYKKGDVSMVIAPPGTGKSIFLVNEGVKAAMHGYKVLHVYIGDMSLEDGVLRYSANITRLTQNTLVGMDAPSIARALTVKNEVARVFDNINILAYPPLSLNINDLIQNVYEDQKENKVVYDMICIDYPDNLMPTENNMYENGGVIYANIEKLAKENNSVVLTASQPKNNQWNQEIITLDGAAESSKKQHHVDMMITLGKSFMWNGLQYCKMALVKVRKGTKFIASVEVNGGLSSIVTVSDTDYEKYKASVLTPIEYGNINNPN